MPHNASQILQKVTCSPVTTGVNATVAGALMSRTRSVPRPRHQASRWLRPVLRPFFRYSSGRDAWVLRGIGRSRGPVIRGL